MKRRPIRGLTVKKQVLDLVASGADKIKTRGEELWHNRRLNSTVKRIGDLMAVPVRNLHTLVTRVASGPPEDFWAVDIGDNGIRLARLRKQENGNYALRDFFYQPLHLSDHKNSEKTLDEKAAALKDLLQRADAGGKNVVCSISGRSVFTRKRTLPPVPEDKIKKLVDYEIRQQIPFPLEQICTDYCVLSRIGDGSYNVLVAAIKEDVLDVFLEVFEAAGCRVHGVSVNIFPAYNWLAYNGQLDSRENPTALINIGSKTTEVACAVAGQFQFTRPLNYGFDDISEDLEKLADISGMDPALQESATMALKRLVDEIEKSLRYFRSLPGGKKVNKIVLTGLTGLNTGLDELADYLSKKLEIEVVIANVLAKLEVAGYNGDSLDFGCMATVLGLALSCQQDVPVDINLLPE